MKNKIKNEINNTSQIREKQTGPEELGEGASKLIKGTCDALLNTLAASLELTRAGTSKLSEIFGNKNPDIKSNRKAITKHHLNQTKKALNKTGTGIGEIIKGGFKTTKGAIRTVFSSGKNTIKGLREDDSENNKKTKKNK